MSESRRWSWQEPDAAEEQPADTDRFLLHQWYVKGIFYKEAHNTADQASRSQRKVPLKNRSFDMKNVLWLFLTVYAENLLDRTEGFC